MKKNISINISGIIFHIEEDGYEELKNYLESINRYFSTFEDSKEIIDDIESRIAEIFLARLKDGKQVITQSDIKDLIGTMGSVADFEAIEEQELPDERIEEEQEEKVQEEKTERSTRGPKKLYRDLNRRILGGVAAGIAHYFGIDSLWVRLLFLLVFLNVTIPEFGIPQISGAITLAYIILWIIVPGTRELDEDKKVKKLFRDSEDRVFGGVASGLASYFGSDPTLIRILFILFTLLGGSGIVIYIILWIITPSAVSITDKIQMKGDPVTLTNIETSIKKNLNVKDGEDENAFVKVILFPFRLLATIFGGLGKILGPSLRFLAEALRIFAGAVIILISVVTIIALIVAFSAALGFHQISGAEFSLLQHQFPMELVRESFSTLSLLAMFIFVAIPFLGFAFVGITVITKRKSSSTPVNWAMFSVWIASVLVISFTVPGIFWELRESSTVKEIISYEVNGSPVLNLDDKEHHYYEEVDLKLRGHNSDEVKIVKYQYAKGSTINIAEANARKITYDILNTDSVFHLSPSFDLPKNEPYRMQELDVTIYLPYNKPFIITESIKNAIRSKRRFSSSYYVLNNPGDQVWVFTAENRLKCVSCTEEPTDDNYSVEDYSRDDSELLEIGEFNQIEIDGNFQIEIQRSESYEVSLYGNDSYFDDIDVFNDNGTLILKNNYDSRNTWNTLKAVNIVIKTPDVSRLTVSGDNELKLRGLKQSELSISIEGNSEIDGRIDVEELNLLLKAASKIDLRGSGDIMRVTMSGASDLDSYDFLAEEVDITSSGSSRAKVYAERYLDAEAKSLSRIKFKGNPQANLDDSAGGTIIRD